MNINKSVLVILFFFFSNTTIMACYCGIITGFCESITENSKVVEARLINFYEATNSDNKYVDIEITSLLYGFDTLAYDTLTIFDYYTDCDLALYSWAELGDKFVFMFEKLETEEEANYPALNLNTCNIKHLQLLDDSISGVFAHNFSSFNANIDTMKYEPFMNDLVNTCELLQLNNSSMVCQAQNRILVDGIFDDWNECPSIYSDVIGDGGVSGVDFGQLQIYNDQQYIFFLLETGAEINLQDLNDITIYLDTDDDTNTGFSINGIGAELAYNFGNRSGSFYGSGNSFEIFHNDIKLVSAPTVTSNQFEIAIKRDITLSGLPVFRNDDIKIVLKDDSANGDIIPTPNEELLYTFTSNNLEPLPGYSIQKIQDADLRIVSYNVLSNGLFDQSRIPSFTRIFQAIQPDIIGFQEIYEFTSKQVANQMESILPSTNGEQWYHAKEGPDCHAISRYPILESALIPGNNQNAGNGAFLIDVPNIEEEILLIVAHPPCCRNDVERQIEVDLIMEFLREAKNGNGPIPLEADAPIVIVGDMNLVGDHRQLETILSGDIIDESTYGPDFRPDWDGNNLLDSNPYVTGGPFSYTWYDERSSFSPGKLDYIFYSGSNLILQNRYSLFTPFLPKDSITAFNFLADDVLVASDHLPIVADFEFKNLTALNDLSSNLNLGILNIYPNPSFGIVEISFSIHQEDFIDLQLIDQNGNGITILHQKNFIYGKHKFNTSNIPSGLYYLKIMTSTFLDSKKIIIHK